MSSRRVWQGIQDVRRFTKTRTHTYRSVKRIINLGYVYTILDSFCAGTKTIPDRPPLLFPDKNNAFGAITATERNCPLKSLKWSVTYRTRSYYRYTGYLFVSARKAFRYGVNTAPRLRSTNRQRTP